MWQKIRLWKWESKMPKTPKRLFGGKTTEKQGPKGQQCVLTLIDWLHNDIMAQDCPRLKLWFAKNR